MAPRIGALLLLAMAWLPAGCGCAYGGPGCGLPALEGLCEARLGAAQSAVVTAVYGDDTGYHPAVVHSAETEDTSVLTVAPMEQEGELYLTASAPGQTGLQLTVDGWGDRVFTWSFTVVAGPVTASSECDAALLPDPDE